ncbi:MAG TPA: DUF4398 domain-containing protein [Steroidobacteraceae bacterium]
MRSSYPAPVNLTAVLLSGCTSGPPRQTASDLTRARTPVTAAEQGGAQPYAAADLQMARDKVQQADQLAGHEANEADELANDRPGPDVGRGEDYLVASNATPAGRQQNRRVIIILANMSERFAQRSSQASSRQ